MRKGKQKGQRGQKRAKRPFCFFLPSLSFLLRPWRSMLESSEQGSMKQSRRNFLRPLAAKMLKNNVFFTPNFINVRVCNLSGTGAVSVNGNPPTSVFI